MNFFRSVFFLPESEHAEQETFNPAPPGPVRSGPAQPKVKSAGAAPAPPPSVPDRPNYPLSCASRGATRVARSPLRHGNPTSPIFLNLFFSRGGLWVAWSNSITVTDACPLWPSPLPAAAPCQCYCAHLSLPASRGGGARPVHYCNILI